jgi:hypothetical protein
LTAREAWAARGTVEERVPEAAVARIEELAQTRLAGGDVGRQDGAVALGGRVARGDSKVPVTLGGPRRSAHLVDPGEGRRVARELLDESFEHVRLSLDLDEDVRRPVLHEAAQPEAMGETVHERAEAHALHGAAHRDRQPLVLCPHDRLVKALRPRRARHPARPA